MGTILFLAYWILGYLAVPHTIWKGKVFIGTPKALREQRMFLGFFLGWLLIPWWFLQRKG